MTAIDLFRSNPEKVAAANAAAAILDEIAMAIEVDNQAVDVLPDAKEIESVRALTRHAAVMETVNNFRLCRLSLPPPPEEPEPTYPPPETTNQ